MKRIFGLTGQHFWTCIIWPRTSIMSAKRQMDQLTTYKHQHNTSLTTETLYHLICHNCLHLTPFQPSSFISSLISCCLSTCSSTIHHWSNEFSFNLWWILELCMENCNCFTPAKEAGTALGQSQLTGYTFSTEYRIRFYGGQYLSNPDPFLDITTWLHFSGRGQHASV